MSEAYKETIIRLLDKLTDHYAHKVMVYALTLLEIQEENRIKAQEVNHA